MTRLTNDMRESISRRCIETQFNKEVEKFKKEEHELGMKCYHDIFDLKIRKAAEALPQKWLRMDGCLRFNVGGYDIRFTVTPPVPVPYSTSCASLGSVSKELAEACQDFANRKKDAKDKADKARIQLSAMLSKIGTVKSLEKTWPEGRAFYKKYLVVNDGAALPAIQVDDINKLLGLNKDK